MQISCHGVISGMEEFCSNLKRRYLICTEYFMSQERNSKARSKFINYFLRSDWDRCQRRLSGVFLCCPLPYCFEIEPLTEPQAHWFGIDCLVEIFWDLPISTSCLSLLLGLQVHSHAQFCMVTLAIQTRPSCFSSKCSYLPRYLSSSIMF